MMVVRHEYLKVDTRVKAGFHASESGSRTFLDTYQRCFAQKSKSDHG
jgi:hypothetical protein